MPAYLLLVLPFGVLAIFLVRTAQAAYGGSSGVDWEKFPEYDELASRMKVRLSAERRWGVGRVRGLASTNPLKGAVMLDKKLFSRLNDEQRLCVVAHELAHIKMRNTLFGSVVLLLGVALSAAAAISGSVALTLLTLAVSFGLLVAYRRSSEYAADAMAARFTDPRAALSMFKEITKNPGAATLNLTHPSYEERASKLARGSNLRDA